MNKKEVKELPLGLYRIYWKSEGSSLAAVGNTSEGKRWIAPCNWVNVPTTTHWRSVERAVLIEAS